ncbi:MAG: sulfite exporter TauE/SafE family protein [Caulobacterales bacterium]|nr:sulfite exporter TauE/SafE family protein [Caulobacterales bacterium]MCA0371945.1 sulfite exporter TauE/SafE family protein [Pseudomonadota bacterium]
MAVSPWLMLGIGLIVGGVSGLFGIGGGFLLTPLLILSGIPAPIAVVSGASVSAAASMSSFIPQWEKRALDLRLGLIMVTAGVMGVTLGSIIFRWLSMLGFAELVVRVSYVLLLGFIGTSLLSESLKTMRNAKNPKILKRSKSNIGYLLPFKMRFPRSKLYISILPPVIIGFVIGILSAIMGVGGGFLLVPALIYIVNMPPSLVVGTSIFQVLILASTTAFMQSTSNGGLDVVLSSILIIGAVIGAQVGLFFGRKLCGEQLRILLGLVIIALTMVLALELFLTPKDIYTTSSAGGGL